MALRQATSKSKMLIRIIRSEHRWQIIGNFQPDLVAGLTNHFEYKNFDLNIILFGRFGQTVVATYLSADGGGGGYPFF